jgi:hypothetical protein
MIAFDRRALALCALAALTACSGAASTSAPLLPEFRQAGTGIRGGSTTPYTFTTMDDPSAYSTVNRLLGLNNGGRIVGYYGSGIPSDPSEGYLTIPPYGANNYQSVVYPRAADTIATCLNNARMLAGYYVSSAGKTYGFLLTDGLWWTYQDPHARGKRTTTEILSINDLGTAVGFYKSNSGTGSFELNVALEKYDVVTPPQGDNVIATGINGTGDVVGYMNQGSTTVGFLLKNGTYTTFSYPGAASTQFLGVTAHDYIVGSFKDQAGATHGFLLVSPLWKPGTTWEQIDDPEGIGSTVATSVNIHKALVGYYTDSYGVMHGFLATPGSSGVRRP